MTIRYGKNKTVDKQCVIDLNYRANYEEEEYDSFDYRNYYNFVVQITAIDKPNEFYTTPVTRGIFTVKSKEDGEFFWTVFCEIERFNTGF